MESGKVIRTIPHPDGVKGLAWSSDGKHLACACGDHRAYLWDADTGRQRQVFIGHHAEVIDRSFSPSGDLLVTRSWDDTSRFWDPISGRELLRTSGPWDLAAGREFRLLPAHEGWKGPWYVDIHPDGRLMASSSGDGVRLWDLATGNEIGLLLKGYGGHKGSLDFGPDGTSLIVCGGEGLQR